MAGKTTGNRYAGQCDTCGQWVPAHMGIVTRYPGRAWLLTHTPKRWHGSPISGGYVGGCPDSRPRTRPARRITSHAVYVLRINGTVQNEHVPPVAVLQLRRMPATPGIEISREYRITDACHYCNARPASERGYCSSEQCRRGRDVAATRQIDATLRVAA